LKFFEMGLQVAETTWGKLFFKKVFPENSIELTLMKKKTKEGD